jgi:hypothetical protein
MSKKINLVYEWLGPNGPISNNKLPTAGDFMMAQTDVHFQWMKADLFHKPHYYARIKNCRLISSHRLPDETFLYELNFHLYHYRDLMHNFHPADGLLDQNQIHYKVMSRIKDKTAYILVTQLFEGYMQDEFLKGMTEYFNTKHIPLSQIIYLTNCSNGKEIYDDFCKRNNLPVEMHMEYLPTFRVDRANIDEAITESLSTEYIPGPRLKTFLCFNRRYSDHRLLVFLFLSKKNLLSQCYISMAKTQPEANRSFKENVKYLLSRINPYNFEPDDVIEADNKLPLILDSEDFSKYPMEQTIDPVRDLYKNSLINIITETYFFSKIIHITEKSYKPIAFMQPFVMIGSYGSLEHIKEMGFKTFGDFWDESYDLEKDDVKRFTMAMDVIENISAWTEEQRIEFTYKVKDIVEYNVKHLNSMPNSEIDNFVEKYGT